MLASGLSAAGAAPALGPAILAASTATTTTLTTAPAAPVFGQSVILTANVAPASGTASPTGSVEFFEGTKLLGIAGLIGTQAAISVNTLGVGSHSITAHYVGDANFSASTSAAKTVDVTQSGTNTSVVVSPLGLVFGQSATLTATVAAASPGGGTPSGVVDFFVGSTPAGSAVLVNGVASITNTTLPVGQSEVTAKYLGSGNYKASTSPVVAISVAKATTTTSLTAFPTSTPAGGSVLLTAAVAVSGPGTGTPTGSVTFSSGSTVLGTAPLGAGGKATLNTTALPLGSDAVTATYQGDARFAKSTSSAVTVNVTPAVATVALVATPSPAPLNQPVTLTATVASTAANAGVPTGSVAFFSDGTPLGTVALTNGTAALTATTVTAGRHTLTARYSGDTGHAAATSAAVNLIVGNAIQVYLNDVYIAVLHRPIDAAALATYSAQLAAGVPRIKVVTAIVHSTEAQVVRVQGAFQAYLGRPATLTEVSHTLRAAKAGHTSIEAVILGSNDYARTRGEGTVDSLIQAQSQDVLGAQLKQPLYQSLAARLAAGASTQSIAETLLNGQAGQAAFVSAAVAQFLGRTATPQDVARYVAVMGGRYEPAKAVAAILASNEYYLKATTGTA